MKLKEMKKKARQGFKKHYVVFVLVCLISALMGSEFSTVLDSYDIITDDNKIETYYRDASSMPFTLSSITDEFIYKRIADYQQSYKETLQNNHDKNWKIKTLEFGRQQGVLASLLNMRDSGSITNILMTTVYSIIGSKGVATTIAIVFVLLLIILIWLFFINTFSIVTRRFFLEGRTYKKVPINRFLFLFQNKNFFKTGITLIVKDLFLLLWSLTIVGGFIKYYSYYMVPYILAENPQIKPLTAIRLSKEMMKGHKWQCFCYNLSFIGWKILNIFTLGILNILYVTPYKIATMTEYYTEIRQQAKNKGIENATLLNDKYLYKVASEESIKKEYADIIKLKEMGDLEVPKRKGIWGFLSNNFGIILKYDETEKAYIENVQRKSTIKSYDNIVNRQEYPTRFLFNQTSKLKNRINGLHYFRNYSLCSIIIMFFVFSFAGWAWEVAFHLVSDGKFVNRGVLTGPWLPIYGYGCLMILLLLHKLKNRPVLMFASAVTLCGIVEYFTAVFLEIMYNEQWWDYHGYFLNIDGKVCAEGLLVFGIGGMLVVYFVAPLIDSLLRNVSLKILLPICIVLVMIFTIDQITSISSPNTGKGITDQTPETTVSQNVETATS